MYIIKWVIDFELNCQGIFDHQNENLVSRSMNRDIQTRRGRAVSAVAAGG